MMIFMMVLTWVRRRLDTTGMGNGLLLRINMTEWLFDIGYIYISKWIPARRQPGWLDRFSYLLIVLYLVSLEEDFPFDACSFV